MWGSVFYPKTLCQTDYQARYPTTDFIFILLDKLNLELFQFDQQSAVNTGFHGDEKNIGCLIIMAVIPTTRNKQNNYSQIWIHEFQNPVINLLN